MLNRLIPMMAMTCATVSTAPAASPPDVRITSAEQTRENNGSIWAKTSGEVHGRLIFLRLNLLCDESDPRAVRKALATAMGVNFVDHFPSLAATDAPFPPLSLSLRDISASDALKTIVAASSLTNSGCWQVRDGILEVGPKAILAQRTPPITRVYDVADLLLEPSQFRAPVVAAGVQLTGKASRSNDRQTPREIAATLMESIVTTVSPEAWQPATPSEIEDGAPVTADPRDPANGYNLDPNARFEETNTLLPLKVTGKWASIVYKNKAIIVRGPAFVHLGIAGLPEPVPPPASIVGMTRH